MSCAYERSFDYKYSTAISEISLKDQLMAVIAPVIDTIRRHRQCRCDVNDVTTNADPVNPIRLPAQINFRGELDSPCDEFACYEFRGEILFLLRTNERTE